MLLKINRDVSRVLALRREVICKSCIYPMMRASGVRYFAVTMMFAEGHTVREEANQTTAPTRSVVPGGNCGRHETCASCVAQEGCVFCEDKVSKGRMGRIKKNRCHTAEHAIESKRLCSHAEGWKVSTVTVNNWDESPRFVRAIEGTGSQELPLWTQMGGLRTVESNKCELIRVWNPSAAVMKSSTWAQLQEMLPSDCCDHLATTSSTQTQAGEKPSAFGKQHA